MDTNRLSDDIFNRLQKRKELIHKDLTSADLEVIFNELDVYETELLAQNDELQKVQSELRLAKQEYEVLFRNSPIALIIVDRSLGVVRFNKVAEQIFHSSSQNLLISIAKEDKNPFIKWFEFNQFEDSSIIVTLKCEDKQYKKFKIEGDVFPNNLKWIMLSLSDIDQEYKLLEEKIQSLEQEKQKQQEMLMIQSKITAMGEMLNNIAHQWRQPLSIISTHVSGLKLFNELGEKVSPEKLNECTDSVLFQVDYLSKTIDNFKNFFKSDTVTCTRFNIQDTLESINKLIIHSLKNNSIQCKKTLDDVFLDCNENQLMQALLNICNNAIDVMISNIEDTTKRYFLVTLTTKNQNAIITFTDSGGGIDEDIKNKIFEPYFSTKHQSIGTGIGLYMTYQIITNHFEGTIEVNNVNFEYDGKVLNGAEFIITLPLKHKA